MILSDTLPELPAQITALGILAAVVWWLLKRMDRTDATREAEMRQKETENAALQTKLETLVMDNAVQHRQKHDALNKWSAAKGTLMLFKRAARRCTCGAMSGLDAFMDQDD